LSDWSVTTPDEQYAVEIQDVGGYMPGRFYQRELKPLVEIIKKIQAPVKYFEIDAYCHLSDSKEPGLGQYLFQELPPNSVVIGVAKNRFQTTTHAFELHRGGSKRPFFITSIGIEYYQAADFIKSMAGDHRIPTLLKTVDGLSGSNSGPHQTPLQ
jgi:deoxyribonuclease V